MPAIRVENLSKSYLVGHNTQKLERYTALRDVIARSGRDLLRKTRDMIHGRPIIQGDDVEEFWALKDISFEVHHGETLGIIGRNGAGKSTLLKILSRITEPTEGRITLNGRVASLLEVGTGFHPELSGRENIFLNGAILGMTRVEIQRKFDEIVAFAEVEKFLDTPVKRYSSGMYVRLAFAVAAHLEPEILVVDEVLAVGDVQFQKKCLGKMGDVAREGRTIIFVSHNMAAIENLCENAILINGGQLRAIGRTNEVIKNYYQESSSHQELSLPNRQERRGSGLARFSKIEFRDEENRPCQDLICGSKVQIILEIASATSALIMNRLSVSIGIDNSSGQRVVHLSNEAIGEEVVDFHVNRDIFVFEIKRVQLVAGAYTVVLFMSCNGEIIDWVQDATRFNVLSGDFYGSGRLPPQGQGLFLADYSFKVGLSHA